MLADELDENRSQASAQLSELENPAGKDDAGKNEVPVEQDAERID